ncbi:MAG: methionyl-tRNA formyltransferase [Cytophagales bacterium]|nr:methionyl-tRNA formyltransferase [Cytophagales bacterium]
MRLIFAGTPKFAAVALQALLDKGSGLSAEVALVLTQPDRPAGRGLKLQPSAVKQLAQKHGIAVLQPLSLRLDGKYPSEAAAAQKIIEAARADFMIVAAYGLILPEWALNTPTHGCLNIHASLLPRWRGAAPIHRAIEAGDLATGITIMQMDAGLDTGAMLLKQSLPIATDDTTQTLHDKLAALGAGLIQQALRDYAQLQATPQPAAGVTYAAKISKQESAIDWSQSAAVIERKIRALNPAPGCTAELNGETVKVWRAQLEPTLAGIPMNTGHSRDDNLGTLYITELQRAGGKRMSAADYLRGLQSSI